MLHGKQFLIVTKFHLAFLRTNKTAGGTCLDVAMCLFFDCWCEFCPVVETILQNSRCFIAYIVIIVLNSFRKQCIVLLFFALEYEV